MRQRPASRRSVTRSQINRETGRMELRTDPNGTTALPSLQFWDHVKRNLDKVKSPDAQDFARVLREHLDTLAPAYKEARAGAAHFFGAENALEAGKAFVTSKMANGEARQALGQDDADRAATVSGRLSSRSSNHR
jgi:hypothetical protein